MSTTVLHALTGVLIAAEGRERELPMPAILFGLIALALFVTALMLTWAFRGTAQKWASDGDDHVEPFHGTHPGAQHKR